MKKITRAVGAVLALASSLVTHTHAAPAPVEPASGASSPIPSPPPMETLRGYLDVDGDILKSQFDQGSRHQFANSPHDPRGYQRFWGLYCGKQLNNGLRALEIAMKSQDGNRIHLAAFVVAKNYGECASASDQGLMPDDAPKLDFWMSMLGYYLHMTAQGQTHGNPAAMKMRAKAYLAYAVEQGNKDAAVALQEIQNREPQPLTANDKDAIALVADNLRSTMDDNQARFWKTYDKKTLQLTGKVVKIGEMEVQLDTATTETNADRRGYWHSIPCMVPPTERDKLLDLNNGKRIKVRGVLNRNALGFWQLSDCTVEPS